MQLVDTHAHICDPVFDGDRAEVLARAAQAGVRVVVAVGETIVDGRRNLALAGEHPLLRPAAGLYPTHLDLEQADEMISFIRAEREHLVAIGEVGLDYWVVKEEEGRALQREIFGGFVELSLELDLPLSVHSRSAGRHAVAFLLERGAARVVMHAFDGKAAAALPAVEAGFFFSIPPSLLRSPQKQKLVRRLPLEQLLLETDSPVLGPTPGARNEPANLTLVLDAIAEIKGVEREEAAEILTENTRRLFGEL